MRSDSRVDLKLLLRNFNFMRYWFSKTSSMTASNILQFVLAIHVLKTSGSGTVFASMLSVVILPRILLTPVAGVVGDRVERVRVMITCSSIATIILLIFGALVFFDGELLLWHIYILVISLEAIEVFYQAASSAMLEQVATTDMLEEAVSLSKLSQGIVLTSAPMLAALVYSQMGVDGGIYMAALLFAIATVLELGIKIIAPIGAQIHKSKESVLSSFKGGFDYLRRDRFLMSFVLIGPLLNFFFSAVYSVAIAFLLLEQYRVGEFVYGIYNAVTASMVIFVPLLILPYAKKINRERVIVRAVFINSMLLFLTTLIIWAVQVFSFDNKTITVAILIAIDCLVIALMMPAHMTISVLYQKTIPNQLRSRVLSITRMLTLISIPLGQLFYGVMVDFAPVYISTFIAASMLLLCSFLYKKTLKGWSTGDQPVSRSK